MNSPSLRDCFVKLGISSGGTVRSASESSVCRPVHWQNPCVRHLPSPYRPVQNLDIEIGIKRNDAPNFFQGAVTTVSLHAVLLYPYKSGKSLDRILNVSLSLRQGIKRLPMARPLQRFLSGGQPSSSAKTTGEPGQRAYV
jgi:hypothetical protein